jgi:DNA-directed RNA polymerase specialized sigma24 family protein
VDDDVAWIYAAATTAAGSEDVARDVTVSVAAAGERRRRAGRAVSRTQLVAEAVRLAVRLEPTPEIAELPGFEREVISLARFARLDVRQISSQCACSTGEVRQAMRDGLRRLAAVECRV